MSLGSFLVGAALFLVTYGSVAFAAARLTGRYGVHLSGPPRAVATAVVFLALLIAVHMVTGMLGILSRWSVVALALALAAGSLRIEATPRGRGEADGGGLGVAPVLAAVAVAVCGAAAAWRISAH